MIERLGPGGSAFAASVALWLVLCVAFLFVDPTVTFWLLLFPGTGILATGLWVVLYTRGNA